MLDVNAIILVLNQSNEFICRVIVYQLMDKFLGLRLRHLPIVESGEFIGLLSPGDIMKAILREKNLEIGRRNSNLGWEYYEQWKPKQKASRMNWMKIHE